MKIAVNTRLLLKDRLEGIGWFTYESLKRITTQHPEHQFHFIFDRKYSDEFIFSDNVIPEVIYPQAGPGGSERLEELGFLPGERVMVLTRGKPGGDPLAVRVGHSTFALRRAEAACVRVRPWPDAEASA